MSITVFANTKGGTSKSTLATNVSAWLAHQGRDVVLLDVDGQASSKNWIDCRNENHPDAPRVHSAQATGDAYRSATDLGKRYDEVVVDTAGSDTKELRSALVAADVVLVPMQATAFDLRTAEHLNEVIALAKGLNPGMRVFAIISRAPNHYGNADAANACDFLADIPELEMLYVRDAMGSSTPAIIHDRQAYKDAALTGQGVIETGNLKAIAEINAICAALFEINTTKLDI